MRFSGWRYGRVKGGVRISAVEKIIEDSLLVRRHIHVAEGLPFAGVHEGAQVLRGRVVDALDPKIGNKPLRALIHAQENSLFVFSTLVIILHTRAHLHVSEAIRLVKGPDGIRIAA